MSEDLKSEIPEDEILLGYEVEEALAPVEAETAATIGSEATKELFGSQLMKEDSEAIEDTNEEDVDKTLTAEGPTWTAKKGTQVQDDGGTGPGVER